MSIATVQDELKSELTSIVRVRNRFAGIRLEDHEKFTYVVRGLLPRLLRRLDANDRREVAKEFLEIKAQIRSNLTGLLSHILERIRLMENTLSSKASLGLVHGVPLPPSPQDWIDATISVLNYLKGTFAQSMTLSLIQAGFVLLLRWKSLSVDEFSRETTSMKGYAQHREATPTNLRLEALSTFLNTAYHRIIQLENGLNDARQNSDDAVVDERQQERLREQIDVSQTQSRTAGWLLLHELQNIQELSRNLSSPPDLSLFEKVGVFHLLLDFFLFDPQRNYNTPTEMKSTGLSRSGLVRMQKQPIHVTNLLTAKQSSSLDLSSAFARFRQWKSNCVKFILERDKSQDDRKLILAIVCSRPDSMDGKAAMSWLENNYVSSFLDNSGRQRMASLPVVFTLFAFLLGQDTAQEVLNGISEERTNGSHLETLTEILAPSVVKGSSMSRMPLPHSHASIVVRYLQKHMNQSILFESKEQNLNCTKGQARLIVRMIAKVRDLDVHWALQLLQPLIVPTIATAEETLSLMDLEHVSWKSDFCDQCIDIARAVLLSLPQTHSLIEEASAMGTGLQPTQNNDVQVLGVPRAAGRRGDVNRLLLEHRARQSTVRLQSLPARESRQIAYRIIELFGRESYFPHNKLLDLAKLLFQCVSFEQHDDLKKNVGTCLDNLLDTYQQSITHLSDTQKHTALAPLLPSLLCVVTVEQPESLALHSVVKWCERLVSPIDPASAHHICGFLAQPIQEEDELVQRAAKRACLGLRHMIQSSSLQSSGVTNCESTRHSVRFYDLNSSESIALLQDMLWDRVKEVSSVNLPENSDEEALLLLISNRFDVSQAKKARGGEVDPYSALLDVECDKVNEDPFYTCPICYEDVDFEQTASLWPCGHRFCLDCWRSFVDTLKRSQDILRATCPDHSCQLRIGPSVFDKIQSGLKAQFEDATIRYFLQVDSHFTPCPGIDCAQVYEVAVGRSDDIIPPLITCTRCNTTFCFGCSEMESHLPALCSELNQWKRLLGKSSFWIKKNSKPCPGCGTPTEKVAGCNSMTCSQCSQEWCWICCARLNSHLEPHACNKFDPAENDDERRALFFTDRFHAHKEAEAFMRDKQRKLGGPDVDPYWLRLGYSCEEEIITLQSAVNVVIRSRAFLKFSYVARFASPSIGDLFEAQQATLELLTERISRLILTDLQNLIEKDGERGLKRFFRVMEFERASIQKWMYRMMYFRSQERFPSTLL